MKAVGGTRGKKEDVDDNDDDDVLHSRFLAGNSDGLRVRRFPYSFVS